jgi:hypothetical protein
VKNVSNNSADRGDGLVTQKSPAILSRGDCGASCSPNETLLVLAVLNKTSDLVRAYYLGHSLLLLLLLLRVRRRLIGCCALAARALERRESQPAGRPLQSRSLIFNFASTRQTAQFVCFESALLGFYAWIHL